ncbi:hypothetical protein [Nocardiopsis chromatogenes]|uniref:hypothetical protein n=1 Tax=Nocardiopsis chromatogenes TaxID=280239 RepID=UPI000347BF3D|nr:hypothetical protein [Nocardiopsis chromatogenes]
MTRTPVIGDDVERAVRLAVEALRAAPAHMWDRQAGPMDESCWDALDHLNTALFSYAVRLAPAHPSPDRVPRVQYERQGVDGPMKAISSERAHGPGARLDLLDAMGGLVAATVRTKPDTVRASHVWGVADPEGFAAMGVVETVVHASDIAEGLGVEWDPPADLVAPALARLFPEAPTGTAPWPTLLWATGRGALDGRERRGPDWSWHSAPLGSG